MPAAKRISVVRRALVAMVVVVLTGHVAAAQELQRVTIAPSTSSLPAAGARIALQLGLFRKNGLDAVVTPMDSGSVASMALISGSADFITSSPTDVVLSNARGQEMVAASAIYRGIAAVLVLARPVAGRLGVPADAPVEQRLKAVAGLTIATPSATSVFTLALKAATESVGARVSFVYMDQPAMVAALRTGAIGGFMASSPFYGLPVVDGTGVMWINGPRGEFPDRFTPANAVTLNVMRAYATAHPDIVRRAAATFADLARAVKDRPAEVKDAMAKVFPGIDARTLDVLWATEAAGYDTVPLDPASMEHEMEFLKTTGVNIPRLGSLDPARLVIRP